MFETTIRHLGGLLGAYTLSKSRAPFGHHTAHGHRDRMDNKLTRNLPAEFQKLRESVGIKVTMTDADRGPPLSMHSSPIATTRGPSHLGRFSSFIDRSVMPKPNFSQPWKDCWEPLDLGNRFLGFFWGGDC